MIIKHQIIEENYQFTYDRLLFNTQIHRELQSQLPWYSFYLTDEVSKKVFAEFHINHDSRKLFAPVKAPYSEFSTTNDLSKERFHYFIREVVEALEIPIINEVRLKLPPKIRNAGFSSSIEQMLSSSGYTVVETDSHWFLDFHSSRNYSKTLTSKEYHRKLRKMDKEAFTVEKEPTSSYLEVYDFIRNCMLGKGYEVSMSKAIFSKYIKLLANRIHVFSVISKGERVASSICLQVNHSVLYDFMHSHDSNYDVYSPVLKLYEGIYDFGRQNGFNWLDMGSASLEGQPNYPLIRFKELAGGKEYSKFIWSKQINID